MGASDIAAVIGVPLAIFTIVFGVYQYLKSRQATRLAHMNTLFRDLLRVEFDFYNSPTTTDAYRDEAKSRLHAYRMWVLEEMFLWLRGVQMEWHFTRKAKAVQVQTIRNWAATLDYHAGKLSAEGWKDFESNAGCYNPDFHAYVMRLKSHPTHTSPLPCPQAPETAAPSGPGARPVSGIKEES